MRILIISCLFFVLTPAVFAEIGKASFYTEACAGGGKTANGERYDEGAFTAAHRSLPFGTQVRVTNRETGRSVVVRINDRGPFVRGRVIDLSKAAFTKIASRKQGVVTVELKVVKDLTASSVDPFVVVLEEVARHQGVKKEEIDFDKGLGPNFKSIVLFCSSRLERNVEGVTVETTVYELLGKFAR